MIKLLVYNPNNYYDLIIVWDFRKARAKNAALRVPDLDSQQYVWGAQVSKVPPEKVRQVIDKWMRNKPLCYLEACRYQGITDFFVKLRERGILIGIFSDYPAEDKFRALGLSSDVIVCAVSKGVNILKPDPKGLKIAAMKLQTPVGECLFIGDRDEKDGECDRRAGMPYLILNKKNRALQFAQLYKWV